MSVTRAFSRAFLGLWRLFHRARAKAFSVAISKAFASFGRRTVIVPPLRLDGERRIALGSDVSVGGGCWLQAIGDSTTVAIEIGDGVSIAGYCVVSAVESVRIEAGALLARNVYLSDHMHAFEDTSSAVQDQGLARQGGVRVGRGAWLGENVVVGPGVSIGDGAVVGANSVVLSDVPAHAVAVGAPARLVRSFGREE